MRIVTVEIDPAGRPVVEVYPAVGTTEAEFRQEYGEQVPSHARVLALVDTGASRTHVENSILDSLGLSRVGETRVHTASSGRTPMNANEHVVNLYLAGAVTGLIASDLRVIAVRDLSGLGVQVLLGRDILDHCLFVYNGPKRQFTLALEEPLGGAHTGDRFA